MREIKFRVWNKEISKITTWEKIKRLRNFNKLLSLNFVTAMQYTGLKDKNGVEIYEGDIVRYILQTSSGIVAMDRISEIIFYDGCFMTDYEMSLANAEIEVLGNIFENPELLEE